MPVQVPIFTDDYDTKAKLPSQFNGITLNENKGNSAYHDKERVFSGNSSYVEMKEYFTKKETVKLHIMRYYKPWNFSIDTSSAVNTVAANLFWK